MKPNQTLLIHFLTKNKTSKLIIAFTHFPSLLSSVFYSSFYFCSLSCILSLLTSFFISVKWISDIFITKCFVSNDCLFHFTEKLYLFSALSSFCFIYWHKMFLTMLLFLLAVFCCTWWFFQILSSELSKKNTQGNNVTSS